MTMASSSVEVQHAAVPGMSLSLPHLHDCQHAWSDYHPKVYKKNAHKYCNACKDVAARNLTLRNWTRLNRGVEDLRFAIQKVLWVHLVLVLRRIRWL